MHPACCDGIYKHHALELHDIVEVEDPITCFKHRQSESGIILGMTRVDVIRM